MAVETKEDGLFWWIWDAGMEDQVLYALLLFDQKVENWKLHNVLKLDVSATWKTTPNGQ